VDLPFYHTRIDWTSLEWTYHLSHDPYPWPTALLELSWQNQLEKSCTRAINTFQLEWGQKTVRLREQTAFSAQVSRRVKLEPKKPSALAG